MRRIDFSVSGEPLIGGSIDIEGVVTTDEEGSLPTVIPIRYDRDVLHVSASDGVFTLHIAFPTASIVTIAPAEEYEGETLVLRADRTAASSS